MSDHTTLTFVGMDVHQDSISLATLDPEGHLTEDRLPADTRAIRSFFERFPRRDAVRTCYEAGPTGYELQRRLAAQGVQCIVIAPALTPRRPGRRIKTDRRDARSLVGLLRAGELTAVHVPRPEDEAVRDLIRAREDLAEDLLRARHRLTKFLLRHDRVYRDGKAWTQRHGAWVRAQRFETPGLERVVEHHLAIVGARVVQKELIEEEIRALAAAPRYAGDVARLSCLRGISTLTALTLLVEVCDFARFASAPAFMSFTGLVASEDSSGERRQQGGITKTGNAHLRRILVEAAWTYRRNAAAGSDWHRRLRGQPPELIAYVMAAQQRLYARYWRLVNRGKRTTVASVAVARELAGFVWGQMNERYTVAG